MALFVVSPGGKPLATIWGLYHVRKILPGIPRGCDSLRKWGKILN